MTCSATSVEKTTNLLGPSEPSICIPRVFANIGQYRIKEIFQKIFGIDCIERVDIVRKNDGQKGDSYNKVFVHFRYWPIQHADIRGKLMNGKEIKIVYEQPWFWKCSASRSKKNSRKVKQNTQPYIVNDEYLKLPPVSILNQYTMSIKKDHKQLDENNKKRMKRKYVDEYTTEATEMVMATETVVKNNVN